MILTTFLVMMSLKPGFSDGITGFYMYAEWDKLADTKVRQEFIGKNLLAKIFGGGLKIFAAGVGGGLHPDLLQPRGGGRQPAAAL